MADKAARLPDFDITVDGEEFTVEEDTVGQEHGEGAARASIIGTTEQDRPGHVRSEV